MNPHFNLLSISTFCSLTFLNAYSSVTERATLAIDLDACSSVTGPTTLVTDLNACSSVTGPATLVTDEYQDVIASDD